VETDKLSGVKILIPSGAGAPGFAGIVRCLREIPEVFIVGGDAKAHVYGAALSDAFVLMPETTMVSEYVEAVVRVSLEHNIQVILPITTRELPVLSENKQRIEALTGAVVVVSSLEGLEIANNKGSLYEFAWQHGFRVPAFAVINGRDSFSREAENLGISHRDLCFKPVLGNGSRGFGRILSEFGNNEDWIKEKSGIMPLSLEEWCTRIPEELGDGEALLLSVYLSGMEYSVDLLCNNGRVAYCVPRSRDKMIGGISVAGTFLQNEGLISECCRLAELLQLDGPIGMQWREDYSGDIYLLEINPRLQGTTSAVALGGLNIPMLAVSQALGGTDVIGDEKIVVNAGLKFAWGGSFVRFWDESLLFER
jgi:carbamoyl-phosphate synthase large subunit